MGGKTSNIIRTIFGLDNAFVRACERILDLLILNLLFVLSCLPLVTIGPAKMALYQVLFALRQQKRVAVLSTYRSAFKQNLKQGFVLGAIEGGISSFCCLDLLVIYRFDLPGEKVAGLLAIAMLLLTMVVFLYAYPMAVRYEMAIKDILKMSFILAGVHLPWTFLMVGTILFIVISLYTTSLTLLLGVSLLLLVGFTSLGYGQIAIIEKLFQRYPTIS